MRLEIIIIVFAAILGGSLSDEDNYTRIKRRMYAMCPPKFIQIGSECYYVSDTEDSWLEAHFRCKDKNSKLAEPEKIADRRLRTFLNSHDKVRSDIWIGGQYNDKTNIWQWGISGRNFTYQSFSQKDPRSSQNFQYYCAVFDPKLKYRWSARPCVDNHRYICQHKMPKVSENHRTKIYSRWNITYPNEMANEVELEVIESRGNGSRVHRRVKPVNSNDIFSYPVINQKQNRRQPNGIKQRRRPFVATPPSKNDVNHGYLSNGLDESQATLSPTQIQFGKEQRRQQRRRNRTSTPEPAYNNETVEQKNDSDKTKAPRQEKEFDRVLAQKRRQEQERKRKLREHRLKRKLLREKEKQMRQDKIKSEEEQRLREQREKEQQELEVVRRQEIEQVENERKEAEFEKRRLQHAKKQLFEQQVRQDEERRAEERRVQEKEENERKQKEEEYRRRQEEEDLRRRQQFEEEQQRQEDEKRENENREAEKRRIQEKLADERKQAEEAENRRRELEQRAHDEYERRQREEEFDNNVNANQPFHKPPTVSEEGTYRRHANNEEPFNNPSVTASQNDLQDKNDQIEGQKKIDEERKETERLHKERLREEAELVRLEEEQRKRAEIQRLREEEIQRRAAAIREQEEEEKRLQEDMKRREEEIQRQQDFEKQQMEENARKELEEKRLEAERREATRLHLETLKAKAEKAQEIEEKQLEEQEKSEKKRRLRERLAKLTPEQQKAFIKLKLKKDRNHNNNEYNIPE